MKKSFIFLLVFLLCGSYFYKVSAAEDVLVVNLQYVVSQSKAGSALRKRTQELGEEIQELQEEAQKYFQEQSKKLDDDRALLSPEVLQQRLDDLRKEAEEKNIELQGKAQNIQQAIQRSSSTIDSVISPILTEIVNEKGAKVLLDRQVILFGDPKLDVSAEVIKQLNKRLPNVEVIVKGQQ